MLKDDLPFLNLNYPKPENPSKQARRDMDLLDNISDAFLAVDNNWCYTYLNHKAEKLLEKTRLEVLGKSMWQIFPSAINSKYYKHCHKAITEQVTVEYEEFYSSVNKWYAVRVYPSSDGLSAYFREIDNSANSNTLPDHFEEVIQQNKRQMQAILDNSPAVIYIKDTQGRYTLVNHYFETVFNVSREKILGKTDCDIFPPEIAEKFQANDQKILAAGIPIEFEETAPHQDGIHTYISVKFPLFDVTGVPYATCGISSDISAMKGMQQAVERQNQRLRLISETASDLLLSKQPLEMLDSLFQKLSEQINLNVYFNYLVDEQKQMLHLVSSQGIPDEVARKIEWLEFNQALYGTVGTESSQIAIANLDQLTELQAALTLTVDAKAYTVQPLIPQGRLLGILGFASSDCSSFNADEIALLKAVCDQMAVAIERASLIISLQKQTEELTEANRIKDEFLAIVSHELRTPLNSMLGWAKMLREGKLNSATTIKALETIERNAKSQAKLIDDILDISRIIHGKIRLEHRRVNLIPVINTAMESVTLEAKAKEIDLKFSILDTDLENGAKDGRKADQFPILNRSQAEIQNPKFLVIGDLDRLQQVVWNLLCNGVKFTPKGGKVEIKLSITKENGHGKLSNSNYAVIQVIDTGKGISPEFIPYIFEQFQQAEGSTTRSNGGLGLGLAIVRQLVELHGGSVLAASEGEGKGATFTVKLPLWKDTNIKINQESPSEIHPALPVFPLSLEGLRILVVDDDADTRDLIAFILEKEGAKVTIVKSANEAIDAVSLKGSFANSSPPDIMLSDIGMPHEDGYSLIGKIRDLGLNFPAIAITAFAREEDSKRAIAAGFNKHLPKPIQATELLKVVSNLMGRVYCSPSSI